MLRCLTTISMIAFGDSHMGQGRSHSDRDDADSAGGEEGLDAQLERAVPSEPPAAFLMVVAGDQPGRVHPISKNTVIIGRSPSADIQVADRSVSNEHARIINGGMGFEVEDLSSTNGTYVGPRKVLRARLKNGDRLRIGAAEFAFLLDRESDQTIALISAAAQIAPVRRQLPAMHQPQHRHHEDDDEGVSLREMVTKGIQIYEFIRRYALLLGFVVGAGVILGFASAFVVPPAASAICQVKLIPAPKMNPVGPQEWVPPEQNEGVKFFEGAERAFMSGDLVRTTLKTLGEDPSGDNVASVLSRLSFTNDGGNLYAAKFKEQSFGTPKHDAVDFLRAHVQNYVNNEINKTLRVFNAEAEFLRGQIKVVDQDLQRVNSELVQFQEANIDRLPSQATQTYASRGQMTMRRAELSSLIRRLEAEASNARRQLDAGNPLAQAKYAGSATYRDGIARVQARLAEARARGLGDQHPEVIALNEEKRQLESTANQTASAETTAFERKGNAALAALESTAAGLEGQLRAYRAEAGDLDRELARLGKVVGDLPRVEARYLELKQMQDGLGKVQAQLFERLKKAEVQVNLERVSVASRYDIVTPPQMEYPQKKKTVLIRTGGGLILGLLLAGIIILIREARRIVSETMLNSPGRQEYLSP
jgi:hypothetical protein